MLKIFDLAAPPPKLLKEGVLVGDVKGFEILLLIPMFILLLARSPLVYGPFEGNVKGGGLGTF